jgi:hypothetical protein
MVLVVLLPSKPIWTQAFYVNQIPSFRDITKGLNELNGGPGWAAKSYLAVKRGQG